MCVLLIYIRSMWLSSLLFSKNGPYCSICWNTWHFCYLGYAALLLKKNTFQYTTWIFDRSQCLEMKNLFHTGRCKGSSLYSWMCRLLCFYFKLCKFFFNYYLFIYLLVAVCLKMYILHSGFYFNAVLRPNGFSVISLKGSLLTLHS